APEVDVALEMAHAHGVKPALLVVPDFHGRAPLYEHPKFCERLRALEAGGHEIYLHGYYHRARSWAEASSESSTLSERAPYAVASSVERRVVPHRATGARARSGAHRDPPCRHALCATPQRGRFTARMGRGRLRGDRRRASVTKLRGAHLHSIATSRA